MSKLDKLASVIPMEEIEQAAQQQIYDVLSLECLKKLAIMPDVHAGYDLPIGGVALLDGYISPSFVGYDIGCGMCFVDTGLPYEKIDCLEEIYAAILDTIPTGFSSQSEPIGAASFTSRVLDKGIVARVNAKAVYQMGTLGGGNHFIELGYNLKGKLCITIHSGSRNVGHTIGGTYMKMGRMFSVKSDLGQAYLEDMGYALTWAFANRYTMMCSVLEILGFTKHSRAAVLRGIINENHNHAIVTPEGILHRKGATPADKDQLGIIPANMRDGVYITKGLGNERFLSSASHGCGRTMGRNLAKKTLDHATFEKQMEGIVCSTDKSILDEAPDAYKDINYVMKAQEGVTVEVVDYIKPVLNIKASE